jgi:hypothetical protein
MRTSRALSFPSRPRSMRLPQCGVVMKNTRWTSGQGLKERAEQKESRSSGSPSSSSIGRSPTSRHGRDALSWTIVFAKQPVHAVPYNNHPVKRHIGPVGVELPLRLVEVAPQRLGRIQDRVARRVAECPELVVVPKG